MASFLKEIQLDQPIDVVSMVMDDFMYHNRFTRGDWDGEMVYVQNQPGSAKRYMIWYYAAGTFHVEAWNKGVFGGKSNPDAVYSRLITSLIGQLKRQNANSMSGGHIGSDPIHHDTPHSDNHTRLRQDTNWQGKGVAVTRSTGTAGARPLGNLPPEALKALLIAGFVFAILFPFVGFILGIVVQIQCAGADDGEMRKLSNLAKGVISLSFLRFAFSFGINIVSILLGML